MIIGYDAKRIVCNRTGLGSYARTLINDLSEVITPDIKLNLYAPDKGDSALRSQVRESAGVRFVYPRRSLSGLQKAWCACTQWWTTSAPTA